MQEIEASNTEFESVIGAVGNHCPQGEASRKKIVEDTKKN